MPRYIVQPDPRRHTAYGAVSGYFRRIGLVAGAVFVTDEDSDGVDADCERFGYIEGGPRGYGDKPLYGYVLDSSLRPEVVADSDTDEPEAPYEKALAWLDDEGILLTSSRILSLARLIESQ